MQTPIGFCNCGEEKSGSSSPLSSNQSIPSSTLGFFLLRPFTGSIGNKQQLICFRSDRLYTIGRKRRHCQIVFDNCCISRRHCQIFLDGADRRLRLADGFYPSRASDLRELRRRFLAGRQGLGLRVSLNGAFVNRRKLQTGAVAELSEGDEVAFGCGNLSFGARCVTWYGFVVERIIFSSFTETVDLCRQPVTKADLLHNLCKSVLRSGDPISYLRCSLYSSFGKISSLHGVRNYDFNASFPVLGSQSYTKLTAKIASNVQNATDGNNLAVDDGGNAEIGPSLISIKSSIKSDKLQRQEGGMSLGSFSDGQNFFLNRLEFMSHGDISCQHTEVTLMELLHPVVGLEQIFIATFTCDISWFLSYCQIPTNLPVTIACHSTEKCWSLSCHNRASTPYSDYPNLLLVYPPFPDEIAFGNNRSKKGVACHHPKLLFLQRNESVRVVVTSANLVSRQLEQIVVRDRTASTILGTVQASVAGLSHRFHNATDSRGEQLKKLASFFGKYLESSSELVEVVLKRNHNIPADDNAISVLVSSSKEMSSGESVQLGFLPRNVAKWAAPLGDHGFIELSAFVFPKEALAASLDGNNTKVECLLSIAQGPKFSEISNLIQPEHFPALCLFIASIQRCLGLWRLQEVMSQFKWPELLETDFVYASSSVGISMNPQFLAAFSAAAGKKSFQSSESEESDPEWGCWRTDHELRNPSVRILFPTIDRVKSSILGIQLSKYLLSFSESTWQRLRNTGILHDAIPNPAYRIGYPMHVKVARRRFQSKSGGQAFGWLYCGSHNFSPAAWGREVQVPSTSGKGRPGTRLRICNYELGIILIIPPPSSTIEPLGNLCNLDHVSLPFAMPAPIYSASDKPATTRAMQDAMVEPVTEQDIEEMDEDEVADDEIVEPSEYVAEENEDDKIYAEMLWSQVDT